MEHILWKRLYPAQLWRLFLARWHYVLLAMVVTSAVAAFASRYYRPPFTASAKVLVQENQSINPFLSDMMVEWSVKNRLPITKNVIRSRQTAETVLRQLGRLKKDSTQAQVDQAVSAFQRQITIYGLGAGIIHVKYKSGSADEVYKGISLLIEIFIAEMLRPQKQALDDSVAFLKTQVERVKKELKGHEDKMRIFKESNSKELPEVYKATIQSYMHITQSRMDAQAALAAKRKDLRITKARLRQHDPVMQEVESKLVRAKQRYEQLRALYKAHHPQVMAARSTYDKLKARQKVLAAKRRHTNIKQLESVAMGKVEVHRGDLDVPMDLLTGDLLRLRQSTNDVGSLENQVKMLDKQAQQTLKRVQSFAQNEQILNGLMRDIEIKSKVYRSLLKRYEDALVTRELTLRDEASRVWIIERPTKPTKNKAIKPPIAAVLGAIIGIALGFALVVVLEFFDPTVRDIWVLEQLNVEILGQIDAVEV